MIATRLPLPALQRRLAQAAIVATLWTAFGMLWAARSFFGKDDGGDWSGFVGASDHVVPFYWAWALLTPAVFAFARRTVARHGPADMRSWARVVYATPLVVIAHGILYIGLLAVIGVEAWKGSAEAMQSFLLRHGGGDVATYLTLTGGWIMVEMTRRARDQEVFGADLATRLARSDIELLRWQLQPHFLFNALNTVSTLVLKGDGAGANRAIEQIARHIRSALNQRGESLTTFAEDVAATREYVAIERLRFGDALSFELFATEEAERALVPAPLLQPLVENAIRHSSAARMPGGVIRVDAAVNHGRLRVTLTDPGATRDGDTTHEGFGLRYVRERMRILHGDAATLTLEVAPTGSVATIEMPVSAT